MTYNFFSMRLVALSLVLSDFGILRLQNLEFSILTSSLLVASSAGLNVSSISLPTSTFMVTGSST